MLDLSEYAAALDAVRRGLAVDPEELIGAARRAGRSPEDVVADLLDGGPRPIFADDPPRCEKCGDRMRIESSRRRPVGVFRYFRCRRCGGPQVKRRFADEAVPRRRRARS